MCLRLARGVLWDASRSAQEDTEKLWGGKHYSTIPIEAHTTGYEKQMKLLP